MMALSLLMLAAAVLCGYLSAKTAAKIGMELRSNVFKTVLGFSSVEMNQFSTASLITRSTNDIQQIQMVTVMLLRMVLYAPVLGIGAILKVVTTKTGMGWIIVLAVVIISGLVLALMGVTLPKFKMMQKLVDRLNLVSREILTGLPVIRAFSREKFEEERFDKANRDLMGTQLFTNRVMTLMMPMMMMPSRMLSEMDTRLLTKEASEASNFLFCVMVYTALVAYLMMNRPMRYTMTAVMMFLPKVMA